MRAKAETRLPWFKFYAGDFMTQMVDVSTAERGCFVSLLAHYWMNGPLPNDLGKLVKIAGLDYNERPPWLNSPALSHWTTDDWRETAEYATGRIVESVLSRFFMRADDGRWIHAGLDEQKAEFTEQQEKRSLGGKMTAEKNKRKASDQREHECPAQCSAPAIQNQIQNQIQSVDTSVVAGNNDDNNPPSALDSVSDDQISEWANAYADVDVKAELLRMRQWLNAHPEKRLTHASFLRFAVKWLSDEQDKADAVRFRTETAAKIYAETPSPTQLRVQGNHEAVVRAMAKRLGISDEEAALQLKSVADPQGEAPRRKLTAGRTIDGEPIKPGLFTPDEMGFFAREHPAVDVRAALAGWQNETDPDVLARMPKTKQQAEFMAYLRRRLTAQRPANA